MFINIQDIFLPTCLFGTYGFLLALETPLYFALLLQGWAYVPVLGFKIYLMVIKQSYIELMNFAIELRYFCIVLNKEDISSYYTASVKHPQSMLIRGQKCSN